MYSTIGIQNWILIIWLVESKLLETEGGTWSPMSIIVLGWKLSQVVFRNVI